MWLLHGPASDHGGIRSYDFPVEHCHTASHMRPASAIAKPHRWRSTVVVETRTVVVETRTVVVETPTVVVETPTVVVETPPLW